MAQRKYCKNTVSGRQGRGKKYPAKVRAEVVMAMIGSNSICAVARKYGVPESTIRSWMAEEAGKPDGVFAEARAQAAREIAARAALGARAQVGYLQQRVAENQRASEICTKLRAKLDEDARARDFAIGGLLKSEAEDLQDAAETGLVVRSAPGTYDRQLSDGERTELAEIAGVVPSLWELGSGCAFRERCPSAHARCAHEVPPMFDAPLPGQSGHAAACWLLAEAAVSKAEEAAA